MKHLLLTTIAAVVLVGCGNPEADRALLKAATEGNIEGTKQLIADGADVNAVNTIRKTPLHRATERGHKETIELLIAKGANVNAKNNGGGTPLDWAVSGGKKATADLLRKHGGKTGEELKAEGK